MLELVIDKCRMEELWDRYYTKIQDSKESIMSLARKYGINHKTVPKWRKRDFVHAERWALKILILLS